MPQIIRQLSFLPILTFLALCALQLVLIWKHDPWLDEWQALQIALQSPSISHLLTNLQYEGHPPLWYLLLQGAALFVAPAFVLPAVQSIMAMAIQAMIYLKAPFTHLERLLIGSSFFVIFDYGTLARSLSLGVMLLIAAFAFRRGAIGWAALALLPLADFLFGVFSLICIILRLRDKNISVVGITAWFLCSIVSAITVMSAKDMIPALWLNGPITDFFTFLNRLSVLLLPLHGPQYGLRWNETLPDMVAPVAGVLFLWLGYRLTRDILLDRLIYCGFSALLLLFSMCIYPLAIRHLSLLALLVILLRWRSHADLQSPSANAMFRIWITAASACGILTAGINVVRPFDTAKQAAAYIQSQGLEGKHWLSFPDSRAQGVSALLGMEFERLERDCTQSFLRWNYRSTIRSQENMDKVVGDIVQSYGRVYLLTDFDLGPDGRADLYKLLKHIPAGYDGQDFYLWVVAPELPETAARPKQCAPARLPLRLNEPY
jgi:hypothetical protein